MSFTESSHDVVGGKVHLLKDGSGPPVVVFHHYIGQREALGPNVRALFQNAFNDPVADELDGTAREAIEQIFNLLAFFSPRRGPAPPPSSATFLSGQPSRQARRV